MKAGPTLGMLLALLLASAGCFSLEGQWAYQPASGNSSQAVTLEIQDYIYRQEQILQKLIFRGCQEILIQSQFTENQVFVNPSSYYTQPIEGQTCGGDNPLDAIFSSLNRVFYFQINIDQLLLNDPYGALVLKFKRITQSSQPQLTGVWTMNQYGSTRTALSVEVGPSFIKLCQGMAEYAYSFPAGRNTILLRTVRNTCPSTELTTAVETARYYRLNDGILSLYDKDIALAAEMIYNKVYDPSKSIFDTSTPAPPAANSTSTAPAVSIAGSWSVITLFDVPFPSTPYYLNISNSTIALLGGCNSHSFLYTLDPANQTITLGPDVSTLKFCADSDDQLYLSGVQKMYKFLLSDTSSGQRLNFYGKDGKIGYALEIKKPAGSAPAAEGHAVQSAVKFDPFASGVVLMLVLKRRDLPRAVVTIDKAKGTLSYTSCNQITQNFAVADSGALSGSVKVGLGAKTSKTCPNNEEQVYVDALNSAVSYVFDPDTKTTIFKDKAGVEVVTFNRT
jgi:heat shock protein HslJ